MTDGPRPTRAIEVFYSYAHEDEGLKLELMKQLANMERQGLIVSWHDRLIKAGGQWAGEIDAHLDSAGIILLLLSPDFMASGYCNDVELKRAMERHRAGEARIIPVVLRPCHWEGAPFERLQMVPKDAQAVTLWPNRDAALLQVAEELYEVVREVAAGGLAPSGGAAAGAAIPPAPVVGFVARRDEQGRDIVERLRAELTPGRRRLLALWGPGGSGKTTLAAEVVAATRHLFGDRVAWASAFGRADFTLSTLLDLVAAQLRRPELRALALEQKAAQVAALVAARPTLVVLDNFETILAEEQERCLDFLAREAACAALITTRSYIDRDDVASVPLAAMSLAEARDFLGRLIEHTRRPANFDKIDRDDLIRRCEANPLVLQWVVRQVELANRPQDVLVELARGQGDAAERVFDRSFNLPQLGDDGRDALLALSLFTPNASREALAQVAGFGDDLGRLGRATERLSALWLIEATDGNERFFLRALTRELARSHLSRPPRPTPLARLAAWGAALLGRPPRPRPDEELRRRYVAHFVAYARRHARATPENFDALEAEKDNLLNVMDTAFALGDWPSINHITNVLYRPDAREGMLSVRGYLDDAIRHSPQAVEAERRQLGERAAAVLISDTATILLRRGEFAKAKAVYEEALATLRRLGGENLVPCLHNLGVATQNLGEFDEARRYHEECLAIRRKLGDVSGIGKSLHQLGRIAEEQGELERAWELYSESLELTKNGDDEVDISIVLKQLGNLAVTKQDYEAARGCYKESLELAERQGYRRGIVLALHGLGYVAKNQGAWAEARQLYEKALEQASNLGFHVEVARLLNALAVLMLEEGDREEAVRLYREALRVAEACGITGQAWVVQVREFLEAESTGDES